MTAVVPELRPVDLLDRLPDLLAADFERRLAVVEAAARRVRHGNDPEAIHDLRVGIRRLSAALVGWKALLRDGSRAQAMRLLRRMRRSLGATREAEVQLADLEPRLRAETPDARFATTDVLLRFARRVARGRMRAMRVARAGRIERLARRVRRATDDLRARLQHRSSIVLEGMQRLEEVEAAALRAFEDAARAPEDVALHRARIALKKWRYAAEIFAEVGIPAVAPAPAAMRSIQDALGEVHDRAVLRDRLASEIERPNDDANISRREALSTLVAAIEAERAHAVEMFLERFESLKASSAGAKPLPVESA